MTERIRPEVYKRMILAKKLHRDATIACSNKRDRIIFMEGILLLHDAAEAALGAVADYLHAKLKGDCYLLGYYDKIKEQDKEHDRTLPYKVQMKNLCTIRNSAKHQGILPDPQSNAHFPETVYALLTELCLTYLNLEFKNVSLIMLLPDVEVRKRIETAETKIEVGDFENALVELAYALHYTCEDFPYWFMPQRDDEGTYMLPLTDTIEHTVKLIQHGVDPYLYGRFKTLTPKLAMNKKTNDIIHWWDQQYGHSANWTETNARLCLDFCIDTALKFQREDDPYKLIPYTDVYEDFIEPTEEIAKIWDKSLQPPRYKFFSNWSSSSERECIWELPKGKGIVGFARDTDPISDEWYVISEAISSKYFSEGHGYVAKSEVKIARKKK